MTNEEIAIMGKYKIYILISKENTKKKYISIFICIYMWEAKRQRMKWNELIMNALQSKILRVFIH